MDPYKINVQQSKLLGNALRIKIISLLGEEARTSKQVADLLGKSPGNVHYHIQQLYKGGLLEIVKTQQVGGVLEKYYKAVATSFSPEETHTPPEGAKSSTKVTSNLLLTAEEAQQFLLEINKVIEKWEKSVPKASEATNEYGAEFMLWEKVENNLNKEGE